MTTQLEHQAQKAMRNAKNSDERREAKEQMDRAKESKQRSKEIRKDLDPIWERWS